MKNVFAQFKARVRPFFSHKLVNTVWHLPLSYIAVFVNGYPGKKLTLIGVTGTDGKTTTVNLIYHILRTSGKRVSMISSVNAVIGSKTYDTGFHVTSPHPFDVQRYIRKAAHAGSIYMVLEVTSHALAQHRFSGCDFTVGVLTNITHEHLDYHGNYQEYLDTKLQLLQKSKHAVVNKDDASYRLLGNDIHAKEISYGMKDADLTPRKFPFTTKLIGDFNTQNILASIATAQLIGISDSKIKKAIANFAGVAGRLEVVYDKEFTVIIDFAHTPWAFEQVLTTLKKQAKGQIIHIFGCAALRDHTKRPLMGKISAEYADYIVLTEEDYRVEDIDDIFNQIEEGIKKDISVERIPGRQQAIEHAIVNIAKKGDIVLLTGKAHEKSLCRGTVEYPWDEFKAVKKALELKFQNKS